MIAAAIRSALESATLGDWMNQPLLSADHH